LAVAKKKVDDVRNWLNGCNFRVLLNLDVKLTDK